jgi:Mlc titration factor MtfA (ptsG expression regulator)
MLFRWWRNRRRRKILAEPLPHSWETIIQEGVKHDAVLSPTARTKLRQAVQLIIAEKDWEGCRGLELTDEMRVTIAALAAILILGFDDYYFDNVQTILVYPDAYVVTQEKALGGGATLEEESDRLGEAHHRGPVIVSWDEVREGGLRPGYGQNLVFHEFAHQLDMLNGEFDGTPDLPTRELSERWSKIMDREYRRLQHAEQRGRETLIDPYGASDPVEFFAVTTECFFDTPQAMREQYPELYGLFRDYFKQDPAAWQPFET